MTDYAQLLKYAKNDSQRTYCEHKIKEKSNKKIAKKLGVSVRSVERGLQAIRKNAAKQGYDPENDLTNPVGMGQNLRGASTLYRLPEPDPETGGPILQWVKSQLNKEEEMAEALEEFMEEFATPYKGKSTPVKAPSKVIDELFTFIPVGDPHLGMLAWSDSTGHSNFDTDIAEKELTQAFKVIIDQSPESHTVMLCNLGDLFHCDGNKPFTPLSGNLLESDGRFGHTYRAAARIFRAAVEYAKKKYQIVYIKNVPGNHDDTMSRVFNITLQLFYENDPRVIIPCNEAKMSHFNWGQTGLWFHHTDRINDQRLYEKITRDFPKEWGAVMYRHLHGGHIHHYTAKEMGGLIKESWNTLAPPDNYHAAAGYGSTQSISSVTYHKTFGEVSRNKVGLQYIRSTFS